MIKSFLLQKKLGRGIFLIFGIFVFLVSIQTVNAAPLIFEQTDWTGGQTTNVANDTLNQVGWDEYDTRDMVVNTTTDLTLQAVSASSTQTSDTDFALGVDINTKTNDSGDAAAITLLEAGGETVTKVTTGNYYTCAITNSENVYCWGNNSNGQLGDDSTTNSNTPVKVHDGEATGSDSDSGYLINVNSITAGYAHTCATTNSGNIYCWGNNSKGQLGNSSIAQRNTPVKVHDGAATGSDSYSGYLINVNSITAGNLHTCATTNSGNVYCWGNNGNGQLGDSSITQRNTPVKVQDGGAIGSDSDSEYLINVNSITAGYSHTCATTNSGNAYCWGLNSYGRLGDDSTTNSNTPVKVHDGAATGSDSYSGYLINVNSITAGSVYTCATTNSGNVYCWGRNSYGQLGDDSTTQRNTPVKVQDGEATGSDSYSGYLINVNSITAGNVHTCATTNSGNVYCWGLNGYGRLGDDSTTQRNTPIKVHDGEATGSDSYSGYLINVNSITAGYEHTCATTNSGNVYCWGNNSYGKLGDDTTTHRHVPTKTVGALNAIYNTSGIFTSNAIDTTSQNTFTTLNYNKSTPTNTNLTVDVRAGNTSMPDGTWTTWQMDILDGGNISALNNNRFVQYQLNLSTTDTATTPVLEDINFNYQTDAIGDFNLISSTYNTEELLNKINNISWNETLLSNTDVKFQLRISSDGSAWSNWCGPDDGVDNSCNSFSYFTDSTGSEIIDDTQSDGTGDQYFQYKAILSSTDGVTFPILSDVSIEYGGISGIIIPDPNNADMDNAVADGYITVDNGSITNTTQTTTQVQVTFQSNNTNAIFPENTIITEEGNQSFNFQSFITENTIATVQESEENAIGAVKLGVPGISLDFTNDITIEITVSEAYNGMEMDILYQDDGDTEWIAHTTPTCIITNGTCTFTTDHATTYVVNGDGSISGYDEIDINVEVQDTLSLDCYDKDGSSGDHDVTLGVAGIVTAGTPVTGESTCNVTTNDDQGYYLTVVNSSTNGGTGNVLEHQDPNTPATWYSIDDMTAWDDTTIGGQGGTTTWTNGTTTGLGFSIIAFPEASLTNNEFENTWVEGTCGDSSNRYTGIPDLAQTISAVTSYQETATTTDICYKVDVSPSQQSGIYAGQVTYTATTDASSYYKQD